MLAVPAPVEEDARFTVGDDALGVRHVGCGYECALAAKR